MSQNCALSEAVRKSVCRTCSLYNRKYKKSTYSKSRGLTKNSIISRMSISYSPEICQIPKLADKLKELAAGGELRFENVPKDQVGKLKMNLTLSGFIQVTESSGVVTASKPNVNFLNFFFDIF